jgi:hypothetical protein
MGRLVIYGLFFSLLLLLLLFEAELPAGHTKPTMMMTPNSFYFSFFLFFPSSYLFYFQSKQFVLYKVEGWSLPGLLLFEKKSRSLPGYL